MLPVVVRDNNVDKALKILKRALQKSGFNKEHRRHRAYIKPSEKRQQKQAESRRRLIKNMRRRMVKEGY